MYSFKRGRENNWFHVTWSDLLFICGTKNYWFKLIIVIRNVRTLHIINIYSLLRNINSRFLGCGKSMCQCLNVLIMNKTSRRLYNTECLPYNVSLGSFTAVTTGSYAVESGYSTKAVYSIICTKRPCFVYNDKRACDKCWVKFNNTASV